ncbi:hypothetical protein BY996DRAFT_6486833 [Phakopsora pachyrhizi]|nr:hypothetical protein BY996DRAFT_6486833 [Phakopsora pachyrhizi]
MRQNWVHKVGTPEREEETVDDQGPTIERACLMELEEKETKEGLSFDRRAKAYVTTNTDRGKASWAEFKREGQEINKSWKEKYTRRRLTEGQEIDKSWKEVEGEDQ